MANIVVVDYGLGNIRSVSGAIKKLGHHCVVSGNVDDLRSADALVLPGVGAFGDGMRKLRQNGLIEPLTEEVLQNGKPILGICLGAQLMAETGVEFGTHDGLAWIAADVHRLVPGDLPLPHVGWNDVETVAGSQLYDGIEETPLAYFVHTYHVDCRDPELVTAHCTYGQRFVASFERENIFGTQYHPEKSQASGLSILKNFLNIAH